MDMDEKNIKPRRKAKELNIQIGERCRQARDASGYTQEQLAELIDVSTQFLSDAERGVTGMSVSTIIKLCTVLSVSADFILFGKTNDIPTENALSIYTRINHLSPQEQALIEEMANLMIKSFHMKN